MLHLQSAHTSSKIREGIAAYKALYLLVFFIPGVAAFDYILQGIEKKNLQPMLDHVEAFLGTSAGFSGGDKLGEGDVSVLLPSTSLLLCRLNTPVSTFGSSGCEDMSTGRSATRSGAADTSS